MIRRGFKAHQMFMGISSYSKDAEFQDVLERRSAARVAGDPEQIAIQKQKDAAQAQIDAKDALDKLPKSFKGPEGFSNVVGVGANPVIEAMASQLEETKRTNELLSQLVTTRAYTSTDFTKEDPHVTGYGDQM